jgi:hypothetical protein
MNSSAYSAEIKPLRSLNILVHQHQIYCMETVPMDFPLPDLPVREDAP